MTVAPYRYFRNPLAFVTGLIRIVNGFLSNIIVVRSEHFGAINDTL